MPAPVIYKSRPGVHKWKLKLCEGMPQAGGGDYGDVISDLTAVARARSITFTRNRPWQFTFQVKSNDPLIAGLHSDGYRKLTKQMRTVKLFREEWPLDDSPSIDVIRANMWVQNISHGGAENDWFSTVTCYCPMQRLNKLYTRDNAGTALGLVSWSNSYPSYIIRHIVRRAQDPAILGGPVGIYLPNPDSNRPQTQRINYSTQQQKVYDSIQPLLDAYNLGVDIELRPLDNSGDLHMVRLYLWNPQGSDVSADVEFVWGMAPHTAQNLTWDENGDATINDATVIGHSLNDASVKFSNSVDLGSRGRVGHYEDLRSYVDIGDIDLLDKLADTEVQFAANGLDTVTFTPTPKLAKDPWNDYWLGDLAAVKASPRMCGGFHAKCQLNQIVLELPDDGGEIVSSLSTTKLDAIA